MRDRACRFISCLFFLAAGGIGSPSYAIIGGTPVNTGEFAATLILTSPAGSCSATLIGPRVLITSASCVADAVQMRVSNGETSIRCDRHPDYQPMLTADVALCLLDQEIAGVPSERIPSGPMNLAKIERVILVGFGCTKRDGVDRQLGQLTAGEARLTKTASEKGLLSATGASVCFGDGGGGVYAGDVSKWQLLAINSAGDLKGRSALWPIATAEFIAWATTWSAQRNAKICGLDESACRAGGGLSIVPAEAALAGAQVSQVIHESQVLIASADGVTTDNQNELQRVTKVLARKDATVRELASLLCGRPQGEDYFQQFEQYHARANTLYTRETKFDREVSVDFPACGVSAATYEMFTTIEGDYAWRYYLPILKRKLTPPWKDFERRKNFYVKDENSEYFLDVLAALNPETNVLALVPNAKLKVPLVPKKASARQFDAAVPPSTRPIFSLQSASDDCSLPTPLVNYPFNAARVMDILRLNRDARASPRGPVGVLVADSGLFGAGRGVFPEHVLLKSGPIDAFAQAVDPTSLLEGTDASHGTEVASLAIGGDVLGRMNAISQAPRVQLVVKPIYRKFAQGKASWVGTEENLFENLFGVAKKHGSYIVNLSIKTQAEISGLSSQLNESSPYLFVVAAGNAEGGVPQRLGSAGQSPIYPAMYGGDGNGVYNLIAVSALHWDAKKKGLRVAPFSHLGNEWIELAAPGCKIPVISYDASSRAWVAQNRTGTSFAAPLVTFAAALVKSERGAGGTPVDIKRRLLISADLVPDAASDVVDGRVLNIAKALAVENDVIELSGTGRLVVGAASFVLKGQQKTDDNFIEFRCLTATGKAAVTARIGDILKIRPRFRQVGADQVAKVYLKPLTGANRLFRNHECELPDSLAIVARDYERETEESFNMDEIADLVRRD